MYPALNIGPMVLPTAALVYLVGLWLLLYLAERTARLLDQDPELISSMVTTGLISGFIGARHT